MKILENALRTEEPFWNCGKDSSLSESSTDTSTGSRKPRKSFSPTKVILSGPIFFPFQKTFLFMSYNLWREKERDQSPTKIWILSRDKSETRAELEIEVFQWDKNYIQKATWMTGRPTKSEGNTWETRKTSRSRRIATNALANSVERPIHGKHININ